jgi:hypothetical protein
MDIPAADLVMVPGSWSYRRCVANAAVVLRTAEASCVAQGALDERRGYI